MTPTTNGPAVKPVERAAFDTLMKLLDRLEADGITYRMSRQRSETVMIEAAVPGERWEIEVFEDGQIEFERFRSTGHIGDAAELNAELAKHK